MAHGKFVTVINCMDGRTQEPIIKWAKEKFDVDYVDMINEPGPDKILISGDEKLIEYTFKKIQISVEKHGSKRLVVVGHHDCAGNPVSKEKHLEQIKKSVKLAKDRLKNIDVMGIYVNENWEVEGLSV